jgi:hypothetical protein
LEEEGMISSFIILVFFISYSFTAVGNVKSKRGTFWSELKIQSTINKLEKISLDYQPSPDYTQILKGLIQSMISYNPQGVLVGVIKKSLLFNVFFWALLNGSLDRYEFPPDRKLTPQGREDRLRLRTADALLGIQRQIASGYIDDNEFSQKIISELKGIETRLSSMNSEV